MTARVLAATAVACGAALIGISAGGVAATQTALETAKTVQVRDHVCHKPLDERRL